MTAPACTCGGTGICLTCVLADLTAEADALCATLSTGADTLDALTAKHLPTESRAASLSERLAVDLMDAGISALTREPFKPRAA